MKNYIEQLKTYLVHQPVGQEGSLLEMLYFIYRENGGRNEKLDVYFDLIESCTQHLSYKVSNEIMTNAVALCAEQDYASFMDGVRVGAQLALELMEQQTGISKEPRR